METIARRVAEELAAREERLSPAREQRAGVTKLLNAKEVAEMLGVTRGWVYEHSDELGALRMGGGPKARLRFRRDRVEAFLGLRKAPTSPDQAPAPKGSAKARRRRQNAPEGMTPRGNPLIMPKL